MQYQLYVVSTSKGTRRANPPDFPVGKVTRPVGQRNDIKVVVSSWDKVSPNIPEDWTERFRLKSSTSTWLQNDSVLAPSEYLMNGSRVTWREISKIMGAVLGSDPFNMFAHKLGNKLRLTPFAYHAHLAWNTHSSGGRNRNSTGWNGAVRQSFKGEL